MQSFRQFIAEATDTYPKAGAIVSGLHVKRDVSVPNTDSISASLTDYEVLPGIREIPVSDLGGEKSLSHSSSDVKRSKELAVRIKDSGQIVPLIVVVDKEGPYILEGAHRYDALVYLGIKSFPAMVVLDQESLES